MGTIIRCHCPGCGYQERMFVGGGLRDCEPDTALRAVPDDPALAKALGEGARFQIERDITVCQKCKRLFVVPYVTYWPSDDEFRHTAAACPSCNQLLTRYNRQITSIPCPSCGRTMNLIPAGHWD